MTHQCIRLAGKELFVLLPLKLRLQKEGEFVAIPASSPWWRGFEADGCQMP